MKLKKYTDRFEKIAKEYMDRYKTATEELERADKAAGEYPVRTYVSPEYMQKSYQARADLQAAKNALTNLKFDHDEMMRSVKSVRAELAAELEAAFSASPSQINVQTLELLKSGILTAKEYKRLMDDAEERENFTMTRIVSKYAMDAAKAVEKRDGADSSEARDLRYVALSVQADPGAGILDKYDYLTECLTRCMDNPALLTHWDTLTAETLETLANTNV